MSLPTLYVDRSIIVTARADGTATLKRIWTLTNRSSSAIELTECALFVIVPSDDASIQGAWDGDGASLPYATTPAGDGQRKFICWVNARLTNNTRVEVHLVYDDPHYMEPLRMLEGRMASEFFEREKTMDLDNATEAETSDYKYELFVPDPRRKYLRLIRNPLQRWAVDCSSGDAKVTKERGGAKVTYTCGLRPTERSRNVNVVSLQEGRAVLSMLVGAPLPAVLGVVIDRFMRQFI